MMIDPFGNPEDDSDDFFEAYDANVPRVDLVGRAANGSNGFLLMKSGQDGLMTPDAIRDLIAKSTQTESTMAVQKMIKYTRDGHTVTSARQLTKGQLADAIVKAKAKAKPQVACFDSAGNLIGTVDADAITPLAPAVDPAPPKKAPVAAAPAAPAAPAVAAPAAAAADQGAQEVAKSLAGATFRGDSSSTNFTKAAGTVDDRFTALLKSVDAAHNTQLQNAVAVCALRFVAGGNATSPQAVRMSKLLACEIAAGEQRRQRSRR